MKSVFMSRSSQFAVIAAFSAFAWNAAPATAADLGGDCCADLEERIAELEATTARKGNRKVSLTISGWVNEAVFFWDDGSEKNVYVGTNSLEQSRVKFSGEAKIASNWSAGYTLELGVTGHPSNQWDQAGPNSKGSGTSIDNGITVRKSNWWVKSKELGKLTVGLEGTATYHLLDDADATNTRNVSDAEAAMVAMARFQLRSGGAGVNGLLWTDVARGVNNSTPGQNGRRNIVRYDSPEFAGFVGTATWGEDDMWGLALTYKSTWFNDFKVLGKVGYEKTTDSNTSPCSAAARLDCEWWGAAATVMHEPTGLFVYGGYGEQRDDSELDLNPAANEIDRTWFIQAGIERKFFDLGKTTVFGEYRNDQAGSNLARSFGGSFVHDSDLDFWAAGLIQQISAADTLLYVVYRHADGETTNNAGATVDLDAFDMVITGAKINF